MGTRNAGLGAFIGFMFGGPLGALVGAGVGAACKDDEDKPKKKKRKVSSGGSSYKSSLLSQPISSTPNYDPDWYKIKPISSFPDLSQPEPLLKLADLPKTNSLLDLLPPPSPQKFDLDIVGFKRDRDTSFEPNYGLRESFSPTPLPPLRTHSVGVVGFTRDPHTTAFREVHGLKPYP